MKRPLREFTIAKKVAEKSIRDAIARGKAKRAARGHKCPNCGKVCKSASKLAFHLGQTYGCMARTIASDKYRASLPPKEPKPKPPRKRVKRGELDPYHPERGKLYKGSLLAALLRNADR